jgi:copper chaperone CopZ
MKLSSFSIGIGVFAAIASSLCCIVPLLALLAGTSGLAASFSWMEPARPYLLGLTVLLLGFAWYQHLKPLPADQCGCSEKPKPPFFQSKTYLALITVFAIATATFPLYAHAFYPNAKSRPTAAANSTAIKQVEFAIEGMTCSSCEHHVKTEVEKLPGIVGLVVSYQNGNATVRFDSAQTSVETIANAINSTGYTATPSR